MRERIRWRIACWLNRFPWSCWPSLVDFALNDRRSRRRFEYRLRDIRADRLCREDAAANGECYCRKIRRQP